jgi:adenosylmethionine-8-amino-7-oxononanoate aminotransferase
MMAQQTAVFHRSLEKTYPTAVAGQGVYLQTSDGRKTIDGSSGAAVSSVGHGNMEVVEAICEQARNLAFAHSSFFTSNPAEDLAKVLIDSSDGAFSNVMFLSSGSEAVESALKLARQYHIFNGEPERIHFIGRKDSYHGNTLGALAAGNNPARRAAFDPILSERFHHVSRCFYQKDGTGHPEAEYEDNLITELEDKIAELGVSTVAAVVIETVGGATLGSPEPTLNYLRRLSETCKRHGILTIFDEVMCGMGRTGSYHAWQRYGLVAPDLQPIGKGLGAGYLPLAAVLIGGRVQGLFEQHSKGSNAFVSGHTFQDHPMSCASALAVQKIIQRDALVDRCDRMGERLVRELNGRLPELFKTLGGSIRGCGLFRTVDFGHAASSYGGSIARDVCVEAFRLGAAVYLCSTAVDAILVCPPFIISDIEVAELAKIVAQALRSVLKTRTCELKLDQDISERRAVIM